MAKSSSDANAGRPINRPWVMVAVLAALYMYAFVDRNVLSLLVDPIKADLAISDVQISLLLGVAFSVFYAILNIPAGLTIDRFGRRGIIAGAVAAWSIMTIICGLAMTYWQLFAGRMGVGIAEAFITPAAFSLIRDHVPPIGRGRAFSIMAMAPYVGSAIALIIGGALIGVAGTGFFNPWPLLGHLRHWQIVLVVVGIPGLPLVLLLRLLPADVRVLSETDDGAARFWGLGDALLHVRKTGPVYGLLIGYVTMGSMFAFGNSAWFPAMMSRKFALPIAHVGLTSGPILLASSISGLMVCGLMVDRLRAHGHSVVLYGLIAMALATVAGIATPLVPDRTMAWILYGVTIFFAGAFYSTGATVLSQITPSQVMGKVTALYLLSQTLLGSGLGPTIVALISEHVFTGPRALAYALSCYCAVAGLAGLALALGLTRTLRRVTDGS